MSPSVSRRFFLQTGALAVTALGTVFPGSVLSKTVKRDQRAEAMQYRTLGRTGLNVSALSFGVMRLTEPAVLQEALNMGINYFDTAHSYQNGNNEKMLGSVLKKYGRKKVYVATKIPPYYRKSLGMLLRSRQSMDELLNESLTRLQTDYVDVLFLHNIKDPAWPLRNDLMGFVEVAKKSGKARFIGISFHAEGSTYTDIVDSALKTDIYDVYLATINFKSPADHLSRLERARKKNIGIVAMKTQAGGYAEGRYPALNPHQAALRWVLEKPCVDCAIPGMVNREQLHQNRRALGSGSAWLDRRILAAYYATNKDRLCIRCGRCLATCPAGVAVPDVNRSLMYFEGYGDFALGCQTYRELASSESARACSHCTTPACRCANGIKISERMRYAHSVFS